MEIKATNTASTPSKTIHKLQDLLIKFEHGLFKAIITNKINQETFLLNSKIGSFQITSQLNLTKGDELTLQIKQSTPQTSIRLEVSKIERPIPTTLNTPKIQSSSVNTPKLIIQNPNEALNLIPKQQAHFVAKIVANDQQSIHLQDLKGTLFTLPKENFKTLAFNLNNGEHLVVKWLQTNKVEIKAISTEQLLHQVQSQLLSKQKPSVNTYQRLTHAAFKLFQSIKTETSVINKVPESTQAQIANTPKQSNPPVQNAKITDVKEFINNKTDAPYTQDRHTQKEFQIPPLQKNTVKNELVITNNQVIAVKKVQTELQQLLKSLPLTLKTLSPENIQKLLIDLSIISKPVKAGDTSSSFIQKLSVINLEIEQLLIEADTTRNDKKQNLEDKSILNDFLKNSLNEVKQSLESTLHKLLFQSTTSKLNQEVNVTQLINSQIPFELEKRTKDVALKIKQNKNKQEDAGDSWEIHLSFELGLLGFIATKILLKDNYEVSVLFSAELAKTKQLLDDKKHLFQQQMKGAGFTLANMTIILGKPTDEIMPIKISNKNFIDINV